MGTCLRMLCHFGYQLFRFEALDDISMIRRSIFLRQIDAASAFYFFKDNLSRPVRVTSEKSVYAEELGHRDYIEGMLIISEVYQIHLWFVLILKTHHLFGAEGNLRTFMIYAKTRPSRCVCVRRLCLSNCPVACRFSETSSCRHGLRHEPSCMAAC